MQWSGRRSSCSDIACWGSKTRSRSARRKRRRPSWSFSILDKYNLIIVGNEARKGISPATMEKLESSIVPLVVFMPSTEAEVAEESLSRLAKRVLGVDIKVAN